MEAEVAGRGPWWVEDRSLWAVYSGLSVVGHTWWTVSGRWWVAGRAWQQWAVEAAEGQ